MTTKPSEPRLIQCTAGVRPTTEGTALTTEHWIAAQGIRFFNGLPQKIGGFVSVVFDYSNAIVGSARSVFSTIINGIVYTTIGTHKRLYSLIGSTLTNITPLKTTSTVINAGLATLYGTLANNPITTVSGSKTVTIADSSAARLRAGDLVTLAGATTINAVTDTVLNDVQTVRTVAANGLSFTITVPVAANASGSGGGAGVVRKTGIIQFTSASHGQAEGDRVKILLAADTGGIVAASINLEWIIRNVAANTWDVMTAGTATSSVTGAGGANTTFQVQIDAGQSSETAGQGYGMGPYGVGLYGSALSSASVINPVRIWYTAAQRFSSVVLMTAGNQTGLYEWTGSETVAPVLVSGAPTAINYAFVSDNIVVTLGAGGIENRIKTSDQDDRTNWTSSATNQVFVDDIEGAERLVSHLNVNGVNLLFCKNQTFTMRYIGGQAVWDIHPLSLKIGIIAPQARCEVNGIGYWVGDDNFYMWNGGNIAIVPANTQKQSTLLNYFFQNVNRAQLSKIFMWHDETFNELLIHYPSGTNSEPDKLLRLNLHDYSWTPDVQDRTAAEYPTTNLHYPRLISSANTMYQHEKGSDNDGAALSWSLQTNDIVNGKKNGNHQSIVPDSNQVGNISVEFKGRRFPQSAVLAFDKTYTVAPTTERVTTQLCSRIWNYTLSGSAIGQTWQMGAWIEEIDADGASQ